ncbi:MAG: dTMP kinase [Candidatus Giovannonibacteria bacterium]|nr:dTMP kinase [Candidatus Giovannonibacteria bacterium]
MTKGIFVAIEGVRGTGRRTLADEIELKLAEKGIYTVVTEEPSDGEIGRRIRKILAGKSPMPTNSEFLKLSVKDRAEHIRRTICPFINLGHWVISAGYWLSTLAYGMLEDSAERYLQLHRDIIGEEMLYPHLTLLLDLEVDEALGRIQKAGRQFDWFAKAEKLQKIRTNYLELANRPDLGRIVVIDAGANKEAVLKSAIQSIRPLL